jgi:hypothetical protein
MMMHGLTNPKCIFFCFVIVFRISLPGFLYVKLDANFGSDVPANPSVLVPINDGALSEFISTDILCRESSLKHNIWRRSGGYFQ